MSTACLLEEPFEAGEASTVWESCSELSASTSMYEEAPPMYLTMMKGQIVEL